MLKTCPFNLISANPRILWEITARCNLKCRHCLYYTDDKPICKDLTLSQIRRIVDKISEDGRIKEIWLSGGEPMVRKDIFDIINYISSRGLTPSLSSNGTLIRKREAEKLYSSGIRYVHISIDGSEAATHDILRGVTGAFERTMHSAKVLRESGIMVGSSFMVTQDSIDQIEKMTEMAAKMDLSTLSFYLVEPLGRAAEQNFGNRTELKNRLYELSKSLQSEYKDRAWRLEFPRLFEEKADVLEGCRGDRFLTITAAGELGVCPWLMKSAGSFAGGNLLDVSLESAWHRCREYMQSLREKRAESAACRHCSDKDICGQGCPAVSFYNDCFPFGFDTACTKEDNHAAGFREL